MTARARRNVFCSLIAVSSTILFQNAASAQSAGLFPPPMLARQELPVPSATDDRWHFLIGVPIWFPGYDGTTIVNGQESDEDSHPRDIVQKVNGHLNLAGALHFEAEKNRFGFLADALYMDLRANTDADNGEGSLKAFIGELAGFYTLVEPRAGAKGWGEFRGDVLAGARVTWLELGLETDTLDVSADKTFVDPFVGARVELGLTDWLYYKLRGDIGGFGVGSDLVWNVDTGLEFRLTKNFDIGLGYRWLNYNFQEGSGSNEFEFDATISGPYVNVQFRF